MSHRFIIEIPCDQYSIIKQIGSGTFSDIFSATHIKTNTNVALKISLKTNAEEYDQMLGHEVEINKTLHHPFICKFFTEFETEHLNIIVMELVDGITTLDYVNQTHGLPISEVRDLFTQLLIAMEYLHDEAHITHRDLKLENIMIDDCGHIRLIDFGFSTKKSMMSTICGSIPYCAPEVLSGQLYTKESDVWSMGVILYALYDGNLPFFHSNNNTLAAIICNKDVVFKNDFDESLKDLLTKMLIKEPKQRIKIEDIKNHPFLSQERLLQIDYKQLFSPTQTQNHSSSTAQSIKLAKPSSKLGSSINATSQIRNSGFFRIQSNSINFPAQMPDILHEKITLQTNDIDLSIENRKDFAHNLTKLIEYELFSSIHSSSSAGVVSCENLSLINTPLSLSTNQLSLQASNLLLTANHPGTSDYLNELNHSHHFVLSNRFAGIKHKAEHHDQLRSKSPQNKSSKSPNNSEQMAPEPRYKKQPQNQNQTTQRQYPFYQTHTMSLGMQQQHLILKSHKRHSSNKIVTSQTPFFSPVLNHPKNNLSDE